MYPLLAVTDGTTWVNLFGSKAGFNVSNWNPALPEVKGGGIWQDSPFSQGRIRVAGEFNNIIDPITLTCKNQDMDAVIRDTQNLRRLLNKGVEYWTSKWQNEPVYLVARGSNETNTRYAIIHDWKTPNDSNPFTRGFFGGAKVAIDDFQLIVEHGLWNGYPPGTGGCTPISASGCWCWPSYLVFDGDTSYVDCGSDAGIDNLADNAFTAESWIYALGYGENNYGRIFDKTASGNTGWNIYISNLDGIVGRIYCAVVNAETFLGLANLPLNEWVHVAMCWDDAADRKITLWINGVNFGTPTQGNGAIVVDAANNLFIGNRSDFARGFDGYIGWSRISNIVRYVNTFTPPDRCKLPDIDTNTVAQWIKEGEGNAIDNMEGTAARDGTATYCDWGCDCECNYA